MDQTNPPMSESDTATATAVAASLSEDAATMWQHYKTVQACEPHLRMGQEPLTIAGENPNEKEDGLSGSENRQELGMRGDEAEKENVGGLLGDKEDEVGDISLAVAALVSLPHSSSPADSQTSSPGSSCFITPASTPSRSPSPPPRKSNKRQAALPLQGEFVDGCQDDEQDNGNHSDGPYVPYSPLPHPPTMLNAETQIQVITSDSFSQTHTTITQDSYTNTEKEEPPELIDDESQTDGQEGWEGERREMGTNTELQISPELLERAQLADELVRLRSELAAGVLERNEAKSQQMVAEELSRIVQSELVELRQRNVAETTTRVRLENQLGDLKVELSSAHKELQEKEERITELEDTLKGTSLLVRKLEEQNAVSLMNRGGIDYMLQAKLADARAQEAEQKLEVAQTELLQSQGEVKRLLDRVGEATRDRSEMVSSKVHNQLLQIADERAQAAEQKALQLERELLSVREKYGDSGHIQTSSHLSTFTRPSTYTSTLGGYPSLSSTLLPPYTSPYSLSTSLSTHLPPSTSSLSLEPFKLSFSLPSSSPSSLTTTALLRPESDSERAALPTSIGSSSYPMAASTTDQHTGLLKPSAVLGKGTGSGRHVSWDTSDSKPGQHTTETVLPPVELPVPDFSLPPPDTSTKEGEDKESSSDWSSSDEDDEEGDDDPLRPSTHSALQAQWEWRTMADSLPDNKSPMATGHTPKKKPPPIAPKPRVSWTHSLPTTDPYYQLVEDSSSFLEPTRTSGLTSLTSSFPRPRGPQGRNLPSRFFK